MVVVSHAMDSILLSVKYSCGNLGVRSHTGPEITLVPKYINVANL